MIKKKHQITFQQTDTIEKLQDSIRPCYGAILQYQGMVLITNMNWKGQYEAAIYEFIETPEETGFGDIECRLNLVEISDETYEDSGHAIAWALQEAAK